MTSYRRAIACVVALSVSTGCATKGRSVAALVFGAGLVVGGGVALTTRPHEESSEGIFGSIDPAAIAISALGYSLVTGGLALMVVGALGLRRDPEAELESGRLDLAIAEEAFRKVRPNVMACARGAGQVLVSVRPAFARTRSGVAFTFPFSLQAGSAENAASPEAERDPPGDAPTAVDTPAVGDAL